MSSKKHSLEDGTLAAMNPFIPDLRGDLPSIQMEKKSIHPYPYEGNDLYQNPQLKTALFPSDSSFLEYPNGKNPKRVLQD
jgi:hypothetical protein